jgi:hypothetical protein
MATSFTSVWLVIGYHSMHSQIAKVVKGWHLLFMGANGVPCYGIEVETLNWDPQSGKSHFWPVNERTFRGLDTDWKEALGLTEEEYQKLLTELTQYEESESTRRGETGRAS